MWRPQPQLQAIQWLPQLQQLCMLQLSTACRQPLFSGRSRISPKEVEVPTTTSAPTHPPQAGKSLRSTLAHAACAHTATYCGLIRRPHLRHAAPGRLPQTRRWRSSASAMKRHHQLTPKSHHIHFTVIAGRLPEVYIVHKNAQLCSVHCQSSRSPSRLVDRKDAHPQLHWSALLSQHIQLAEPPVVLACKTLRLLRLLECLRGHNALVSTPCLQHVPQPAHLDQSLGAPQRRTQWHQSQSHYLAASLFQILSRSEPLFSQLCHRLTCDPGSARLQRHQRDGGTVRPRSCMLFVMLVRRGHGQPRQGRTRLTRVCGVCRMQHRLRAMQLLWTRSRWS